jgi:hypothetical protein
MAGGSTLPGPASMLQKLLPQFERLKPGARLVSHEFELPGIPADQTARMISADEGAEHAIHLWTAPLFPHSHNNPQPHKP